MQLSAVCTECKEMFLFTDDLLYVRPMTQCNMNVRPICFRCATTVGSCMGASLRVKIVSDHPNNHHENPNCDGNGPHATSLMVKRMPMPRGGNLILCQTCWGMEIAFRDSRSKEAGQDPTNWPMPAWESAEIYARW